MPKRWRYPLIAGMLLAVLVSLALWLDPTRVLWGSLRGESFYDGRPTGYWSREVARLEDEFGDDRWQMMRRNFSRLVRDREGWWARVTDSLGIDTQPLKLRDLPGWKLVDGDSMPWGRGDIDEAAVPVLRELTRDRNAFVRWAAL